MQFPRVNRSMIRKNISGRLTMGWNGSSFQRKRTSLANFTFDSELHLRSLKLLKHSSLAFIAYKVRESARACVRVSELLPATNAVYGREGGRGVRVEKKLFV